MKNKMKKQPLSIPFDSDGNLLNYILPSMDDVTWRENFEFSTIMTYCGFSRGRSSILFHFTDTQGKKYLMFVSDFDDLLNRKGLEGKTINETFTFCKKGDNYGVKLANSQEEI